MKVIRIALRDGSVWHIPLQRIANMKAKALSVLYDEYMYNVEYEIAMQGTYETVRWFKCNIYWRHIQDIGKQVKSPDAPWTMSEESHLEFYEHWLELSTPTIIDIDLT